MRRNENAWLAASISVLMTAFLSIPSHGQTGLLRFLSPSAGLVARPGQTITIAVAADASVQKLALIGQHPLGVARLASGGEAGIVGRVQGQARPLEFLLAIPTTIQPGMYRVTAIGRMSGGEVESETLALDVEKSQDPVRIWGEPSIIQFSRRGDRVPVRVLGAFADGSQEELTKSRRTKFISADPRVATTTADGLVTAVGSGTTSILVQTPSADYYVPVRVQEQH